MDALPACGPVTLDAGAALRMISCQPCWLRNAAVPGKLISTSGAFFHVMDKCGFARWL